MCQLRMRGLEFLIDLLIQLVTQQLALLSAPQQLLPRVLSAQPRRHLHSLVELVRDVTSHPAMEGFGEPF